MLLKSDRKWVKSKKKLVLVSGEQVSNHFWRVLTQTLRYFHLAYSDPDSETTSSKRMDLWRVYQKEERMCYQESKTENRSLLNIHYDQCYGFIIMIYFPPFILMSNDNYWLACYLVRNNKSVKQNTQYNITSLPQRYICYLLHQHIYPTHMISSVSIYIL